MSHHVTCHVTAMSRDPLLLIKKEKEKEIQIKKNIKSRKIDKRKIDKRKKKKVSVQSVP